MGPTVTLRQLNRWTLARQLLLERAELEAAVLESRVIKATLMRGTLHLVSARDYDRYRVACRDENHPLRRRLRLLGDVGCDLDAIREEKGRGCPRPQPEILG